MIKFVSDLSQVGGFLQVLNTTLCDKVCQCLVTGRWFSPGTPVSSTNRTDRHDITELLLKVALNTIKAMLEDQCDPNLYEFNMSNNITKVSIIFQCTPESTFKTYYYRQLLVCLSTLYISCRKYT